jgi:putative transcriptional regulator
MAKKTDPARRIDEALLEMARDGLLGKATSEKITMRILDGRSREAANLATLRPAEIRALRERANMSQAVFARLLNVTTGYVSQLERGVKRPTGPALALLNVIKRKGVEAVL